MVELTIAQYQKKRKMKSKIRKRTKESRTSLKLHATLLVFAKETSLEDLIKAIRSASKGKSNGDTLIPIYLDPLGLQMADKTMNSPIQWDVGAVPLAASLPLILKQVGLKFHVMSNGLLMIWAKTLIRTLLPTQRHHPG